MNTMMKALLLATTLWATGASAATITFKDGSPMPYLQQFNPLLGTLQSVTFNNRYVVNQYFTFNDPFATTAPLVKVTGTIGDVAYGRVTIDDTFQSIIQTPQLISVNIDRTVQTTFTTNLDYYTGFRLMTVAAFANLSSPGFATTFASYPTPFSYVSVTYNYVASVGGVPEPSTWLTMLIGFGMIGATARYRRKSVQVRYA